MAFEIETYHVELKGDMPLLMNNIEIGCNALHPINKYKKTLTSKRKKTDDDLYSIMKLEWFISLYLDGAHEFTLEDEKFQKDIITFGKAKVTQLPGRILKACIVEGGKKNKLGSTIKQSLRVDPFCKLKFNGPSDPNEMYLSSSKFVDVRSVVVQRSRIMRARPTIPAGWKLSFGLKFFSDVLNVEQVKTALDVASQIIGICDYRVAKGGDFGSFTVTKFEKV